MGLDAVEIVMAVEERFDIAIEDAEAEKTVTPGLLIELVMSKVGRTQDAACLTQRAFHRLRAALMRQFSLKRNQIRPETPLTDLIPRKMRRERLRRILDDIGINKTIALVRPDWLQKTILTSIFTGGAATAIFLAWHPVTSSSRLVNFVTASPIVAAILFVVAFGWLAHFLTRWTLVEFSLDKNTVGKLSRWIVANGPAVVQAPPGQWSREQVAVIVREIVVDTLGCAKQYREDAHFVKDLGLS
jgi:hypothetical protein